MPGRWVVADLVAETPKHVLVSSRCHYHRFFRLPGPTATSEARTADGDIDGFIERPCLSVAGASFQT